MKKNVFRKWFAILAVLVMMPFSAFTGGYAENQVTGDEAAETAQIQTETEPSSDLMPAANPQQGEQETGLSGLLEDFAGKEAQEAGEYRYILLSDQTAALTQYTGHQNAVTVPLSIGGADVSAIADDAFDASVSKITIHGNVLYMGDSALAQGTAIYTWQGAYAARWGQKRGMEVHTLSVGTLYDTAVDMSDVADRIRVLSDTLVSMGKTEGRRLPAGSVFMIYKGEDDEQFFRVKGSRTSGNRVYLTVEREEAINVYKHRIYEGEKAVTKVFTDYDETGIDLDESAIGRRSMLSSGTILEHPAESKERSFGLPGGKKPKPFGKNLTISVDFTLTVKTTCSYFVEIDEGEIKNGTMATETEEKIKVDVKLAFKGKEVKFEGGVTGLGDQERQQEILEALKKTKGKKENENLGSWFFVLVPSIGLGIDIAPSVGLEYGGSGSFSMSSRTLTVQEWVPEKKDWGNSKREDLGHSEPQFIGMIYAKASAKCTFKLSWLGKVSVLQLSAGITAQLQAAFSNDPNQCLAVACNVSAVVEIEAGLWLSLGKWEFQIFGAGTITFTLFSISPEALHFGTQGVHFAGDCEYSPMSYSFRFVTGTDWHIPGMCYLREGTYIRNGLFQAELCTLSVEGIFGNEDVFGLVSEGATIYFDYEEQKYTALSWRPVLPQDPDLKGGNYCKWAVTEPATPGPYIWREDLTVGQNLEAILGHPVQCQDDLPKTITLTAQWDNKCEIIFDPGEGHFEEGSGAVGNTITVYTVPGKTVKPISKIPIKTLSKFTGWALDPYGRNPWNYTEPVTEDLHLYAIYESFDPNDHTTVNSRHGSTPTIIGTIEAPEEREEENWTLRYQDGYIDATTVKAVAKDGLDAFLETTDYAARRMSHGELYCSPELEDCVWTVVTVKDAIISFSLTGLKNPDTIYSEYRMPSTINGLPVTIDRSFCQKLKAAKVIFVSPETGDQITETASSLFAGNTYIQYVDMKYTSLVKLGDYAFQRCSNLRGVLLPGSLQKIGKYAFDECGEITRAEYGRQVDTIDVYAFRNCAKLTEVHVDTPYMSTMKKAFTNTDGAEAQIHLYIGQYVYQIPSNAFEDCNAICALTVEEGSWLESIGTAAFRRCTGMKTATLQGADGVSQLKTINTSAFVSTGLTEIEIPSTVTTYSRATASKYVNEVNIFAGTPIRKMTIGGEIKVIGRYMLEELIGSLEELVLRDGVTTIDDYAFSKYYDNGNLGGFSKLAKVSIPDTLTGIGNYAFYGAGNLVRINDDPATKNGLILPPDITSLGIGTFKKCSSLSEAKLNDKLKSIGSNAFAQTNLSSIEIPRNVSFYAYGGDYHYTDQNIFYGTPIKRMVIGGEITAINEYMLADVAGTLEELVLREGVTSIGAHAFYCQNDKYGRRSSFSRLRTVQLPYSLTEIGANAFEYASALQKISTDPENLDGIYIPNRVTSIGSGAFRNCTGLTELFIPDYSVTTIGSEAFKNCTNLVKAKLNEGLESIGSAAFSKTNLTSIEIPASVRSYSRASDYHYPETNIFYGTPITRMVIGGEITAINEYMLKDLGGTLEELVLREGVTSIGAYAFYCQNDMYGRRGSFSRLRTVQLPNTLTEIGAYALEYATALQKISTDPENLDGIYIPDQVTSIGSGAFLNCTGLTELFIPDYSVTSIGSEAFKGCTNLVKARLNEGLESIGSAAFSKTSLTSIEIPASVRSYSRASDYHYPETNIFYGTPIRRMVIGGEITAINEYMLKDISGTLEELVLREGITAIGAYAFYCKNDKYGGRVSFNRLQTVQLPNTLTEIGAYAFEYAKELKCVFCGPALASIGNSAFLGTTGIHFYRNPGTMRNEWLAGWCTSNGHIYDSEENQTLTVTFVTGAETGLRGSGNTITIPVMGLVPEPEIPVREGYIFMGWYTGTGETPWDFATDTAGIFDFTLTARWLRESINGLYEIREDHAILISYAVSDDESSVVTIPTTWQGHPVTGIADGAFAGERITKIILPAQVTGLSAETFSGADDLSWIAVPGNCLHYKSKAGILYSADMETLIFMPGGMKINTFSVPETVRTIAEGAIAGHREIRTLTLNDGLTAIEDGAFCRCTGITEIFIPGSVASIGEEAFASCTGVSRIYGAEGCRRIGTNAFAGTGSAIFYGAEDSALIRYAKQNGRLYNFYTVTYLIDGEATETRTVQAGNRVPEITPTMPENRMMQGGWFRDAEMAQNWAFDAEMMSYGDLTLYGKSIPIFILEAYTVADEEGEVIEEGWAITGYNGTDEEITVPDYIEGKPVLAVDSGAFGAGSRIHLPWRLIEMRGNGWAELTVYAMQDTPTAELLAEMNIIPAAEKHRLYFETDGGTVIETMEASTGEEITLPTAVRDGSTFLGWDVYGEQPGMPGEIYIMPDYDTVLVAIWDGERPSYDFTWVQEGEAIRIQKGNNTAEIAIPATINGLPVTTIADYAFEDCTELKHISLAEGIQSIGQFAFYRSGLEEIDIPDSAADIGKYAFAHCESLHSISWPSGLALIPDGVLNGDTALSVCEFPAGVLTIGRNALNGCSAITELAIPDDTTTIGEGAFANMGGLQTLWIGKAAENFPVSAVEGCGALTAIHADAENQRYSSLNGVLYNDTRETLVFYPGGKADETFSLPGETVVIGKEAFAEARKILNVELDEGLLEIGESAFADASIAEMDIPDTVLSIGANAFPSGMLLIGEADGTAFAYALRHDLAFRVRNQNTIPAQQITAVKTALTLMKGSAYTVSIQIVPENTTDDVYWTSGDNSILRVDDGYIRPLKTGETEITIWAGNAELTIPVCVMDGAVFEIETPSTLVTAGQSLPLHIRELTDNVHADGIYWTCEGTAGFITEDGILNGYQNGIAKVTAVDRNGNTAFRRYPVLEQGAAMVIPSATEVIEEEAFSGMSSITAVVIQEGDPVRIDDRAFSDCRSLTIILIPDSVTQISDSAFENSEQVTIVCGDGSEAAEYAERNGLDYLIVER